MPQPQEGGRHHHDPPLGTTTTKNGPTRRSFLLTLGFTFFACLGICVSNLWSSNQMLIQSASNDDNNSFIPSIISTGNNNARKNQVAGVEGNVSSFFTLPSIRFIPNAEMGQYYAAAWWQSKDRFLHVRAGPIRNLEDAVFAMIDGQKQKDLRMTTDWLKFSVEHLSKAWKVSGFKLEGETKAYHMFIDKLLGYIRRALATASSTVVYEATSSSSSSPVAASNETERGGQQEGTHRPVVLASGMTKTIAMIAFEPYESGKNATRGQVLSTVNLAGTMASLIRVHCGRIVIVCDQLNFNASTAPIVQATKQLLQEQWSQSMSTSKNNEIDIMIEEQRSKLESFFNSVPTEHENLLQHQVVDPSNPFEYKVGNTEVAVVIVHCNRKDRTQVRAWINDQRVRGLRLIPKAGLMSMKKAFLGTDIAHSRQWLGPAKKSSGSETTTSAGGGNEKAFNDQWDNLYYTEQDTILHAKHNALGALTRELENGKIISPHRLQIIPHERDVPDYDYPDRLVPATGSLAHVEPMGVHDLCCDGGPFLPGVDIPVNDTCDTRWWECGHLPGRNHTRLFHYQLMDLQEGTRIVSLAASNHGRRCHPHKTDDPTMDCPNNSSSN